MMIKLLIILTLLFGIDEMERREPGYGKPGDGQGGGLENNPNVPVDDWVYVLVGVGGWLTSLLPLSILNRFSINPQTIIIVKK
jgi:hypothetical protein